MQLSASFIRSVFLALALAGALAAPPAPVAQSSVLTSVVHEISTGHIVESFYPPSSFETFGDEGIDHPLSARGDFNLEDATVAFVQSHLSVERDSVHVRTSFANDIGVQHAYVVQQINGIPISNAVANVVFNDAGKVVSFGSSFVKPTSFPSTEASVSVEDSISKAQTLLSGMHDGEAPSLEFIAQKDGSLALAYIVHVQKFDAGLSARAFIDAHTGELVHIDNLAASATYRAIPIQQKSPTNGTFTNIVNPQVYAASPNGWHTVNPPVVFDTTAGNNVFSYLVATGYTGVQSSAGQVFQYVQNPAQVYNSQQNINASRTNAFYVTNMMHDISYLYGFNERAFNFQQNNLGKGGKEGDRVNVAVQANDPNNAHFFYSADGQHGLLQLGIWNGSGKNLDSAFANDLIVHEYTHGITSRLTGGGGTGACISTNEAMSLGEGWSDAMADWIGQTSGTVQDFVFASYLAGNTRGIRRYPYSISTRINPLQYSNVSARNEVHDNGEVWGNILHNVYAALVASYGFDANARTNPTGTSGNNVYLHLFIDSLSIQPCNPTFIQARDAWIQADRNRYRGVNNCRLWNAFASRGLGSDATPGPAYTNGFRVPAGC